MNPQMMQMLSAMGMQPGMGPGGAGGAPNMGAAQMANPTLTRLMGQQGGGAPTPPMMPPGAPPPTPGGAAPMPAPPSGISGTAPMAGGPRSNPGMMPGPSGQGPAMAGDSGMKPGGEATGENPQRPAPHNAMPHFPRNQFGAMLLPQGGQVGGSSQPPAQPNQAFNWNNLMSAFLQRQPQGNPMSNVMPQTSPLASPGM